MEKAVWKTRAAKNGWVFSPAHGGYINEARRRQGLGWDSYIVADDAEEACFFDGIETEHAALSALDKEERLAVYEAREPEAVERGPFWREHR